MNYRQLGDSGMKVSEVALGGWINFERKLPEEEARRIILTAYERGINFFDVADVYGQGAAEKWIGGTLNQFPRHTLVISTKVFGQMSEDVNDRGLSRKHIMESIIKSLRRLDTEYVDIYFCHRADPDTPLIETARVMDTLIRQGKVHYWGTSEWSTEEIVEVVDLCEKHNLHTPKVEQPQYSMLARKRVESELLPVTEPRGIGLTVYSPLAMGMLTGKYDDGIPDGSRFDKEEWSKAGFLNNENVEKVKRLEPLAKELGISRAQLALAWVLRQDGVSSAITGATKVQQIEENVKAAKVEIPEAVLSQIDDILTM